MPTTYTPQLSGRFVVPPGYTAALEAVGCDWEADVSGYHLTATGSGRGGVYSTLIFEGTVTAGAGPVPIVTDPSPDTVVIRDVLGVPASEGTLKVYIQPTTGGSGNPCAVIDGGGSSVEGVIVRKFPFAFDTPGLDTGAAVYTPTPGDILMDAWFQIDTFWDGTTPRGDFGPFSGGDTFGMFGDGVGPVDMTNSDGQAPTGILNQTNYSGGSGGTLASAYNISGASLVRWVPGKILGSDPIKVVVSRDGTITGGDPGSTQGSGVLYLVTATPV